MVASTLLGFPRIGPNRELKKAVEAYWAHKIPAQELHATAASLRTANWSTIKAQGVDIVPSGDFSLYDHVLDHSVAFNVIPKRYRHLGLSNLDVYFAMGRGHQSPGVNVPACEMKKWFDSNYHYIVPEFSEDTDFKLIDNKPLSEYKQAKSIGITTRPVIIGPISFLTLGKKTMTARPDFSPISLLPKLIPVYQQLLQELKIEGVDSVQVDEPVLVLDSATALEEQYIQTFHQLASGSPNIILTTYFARLGSSIRFIAQLPVCGLHIDLDRAPDQLDHVVDAIKNTDMVLSLGLISGRNVWKTDLEAAVKVGQKAVTILGEHRVLISTSSSLVHIPVALDLETKLTQEERDWFSFAVEKVREVAVVGWVLSGSWDEHVVQAMEANRKAITLRREFEKSHEDVQVGRRVQEIGPEMMSRKSPFFHRREVQKVNLGLPKFPTTTLGSYPQTNEIRKARVRLRKGDITDQEYEAFMKREIERVVRFQENLGLDLLVHGEPERNDMVQYFAELLDGFVLLENAWVQSYGSRCVRPPIIVSDIRRLKPMTIQWSHFAQELTRKPVKGMLTGPVTILNWSFPREDVSRQCQCQQIALALRDEVIELEQVGRMKAVQVDEPALREGLPLRSEDWDPYLTWSINAFKLATSGVSDQLQLHTHFCYSEWNDRVVVQAMRRMDVDVISIEASRNEDLRGLVNVFFASSSSSSSSRSDGEWCCVGFGIYDVHSVRVPSEEEMREKLNVMVEVLEGSGGSSHSSDAGDLIFVNPDCGLKTRGWDEVEASLKNLVLTAQWARERRGEERRGDTSIKPAK